MSNANYASASKPGIGGAIRVAPYGTTLPTDATSTLNAAFKTLGYISEDGFTNTNGPESSSTKAWGGETIFSGETAKPDKFKTKFLESLNPDLLKVIYGDDNVEVNSDGSLKAVHANSVEHEALSWIIEEKLRNGKKARTVIASGTLTELSDIVHKDGEPMGYEVTITASPDSAHQVTIDGESVDDTHVTYYG